MTDQEICRANDALNKLIERGDRAWSAAKPQFASMFNELVQAVPYARVTLKPLGDPKAAALLDELENLTQRMRGQTLDELLAIAPVFYMGAYTLAYYVRARYTSVGVNMEWFKSWVKYPEASPDDDIDAITEKVTRHLSTLLPRN